MKLDLKKLKLKSDLSIDKNNLFSDKKIIREKCNNKQVITIRFDEINKELYNNFVIELKRIIKKEKLENKKVLIVGLGNSNVTSDSLGIKVINNLEINNKIYAIKPSVKSITGIDSFNIIKGVLNEISIDYLIVIDSLKTNNLLNLNKIIQISNMGIRPGSGVKSKSMEISPETINKKVISIGVPTVISIDSLFVSEINIDTLIDKLAIIISKGINYVIK